jgi:Uma2 family endonuclease
MAIEPKLLTAVDLARWPSDGRRHELVDGVLRTMPPADFEHGDVTSVFDASLGDYVRRNGLGRVVVGDVGFLLKTEPDTVRAPDLAFVRRERLLAAGRVRGYWRGAPDLVVEVISPNDLYADVDEKVADWLTYGTRLVWLVNPRRGTIAAYRPGEPVRVLAENDVLDGADVVPGWTLAVRELFSQAGQS